MGNLNLYGNLLDFLPHASQLPRNASISFTGKDTDFKYSTIYNNGRDAFMGLDVTIFNNSGSTATFFLDGNSYWSLDAVARTLTDIPFNELLIGSTGATANVIDITVFGCKLETLERYATGNREKLEMTFP